MPDRPEAVGGDQVQIVYFIGTPALLIINDYTGREFSESRRGNEKNW